MTTEETTHDCGCNDTPPKTGCGGCDTTLIDTLRCKAEGVAAEAAYNAQYQKDVGDAQAEFNDICNTYRATRTEVKLEINQMRHDTKRAIERIRCMIKQHRVVECLDEAWCEVEHELHCCTQTGCCVKPENCKFPLPEAGTCDTELKKLIAEYTDHTDKAKACFTSLKGESPALKQRVRDRKAELDDIQAKLNANDPATDLKRLYAGALVLRYRLKHIWNGFEETKEFVDCLCHALTCWTEGSGQIAVLKGQLAVRECWEKAKEDRCTYIKEHTVDEILTVYEKECCPDPCPPPTDECDDSDGDDGDHDDCGCGCHDKDRSGTTAD
jgi:hypothetical protein